MPAIWCRLGKMSGSTRHLSATAVAAAVKPCRRPGISALCSPLPQPTIYRAFPKRDVGDAGSAQGAVRLQAIEKGTLQNLIFDNQAFANHRAMAAVFGAILDLPPIKQAMASKQFKSIYLDRLLSMHKERRK